MRLWDSDSGQRLATLRGHESRVRSVAFSPGGNLFLSSGDDGATKLWDSQFLQYVRTFIGERPYERMNTTGAQGLIDAQKAGLRILGALEIAKDTQEQKINIQKTGFVL